MSNGTSDAWSHYAELARRLDAVRSQESARTSGMRAGAAEMTHQADELEARLRGQGGMLGNLAQDLQFRSPKLSPIAPEAPTDPGPALSRVAAAIDRSDAEVRQAVERGRRPELLPGLGEGTRAGLVYGLAAFVVLVVQVLSFRHGHSPSPLRVLLIIPLVGYLLGYAALSLGGRARLSAANGGSTARGSAVKSKVRQKGKKPETVVPPTRPRFGFVLCFGIGPVVFVVYLLSHLAGSVHK
jgi:hypothetical protein